MATRLEVKTRIITELDRDDLAGDLAGTLDTHVDRACEFYADQKFWFNSLIASVATVASTATVAIPATMRVIERVALQGYDYDLQEVLLDDLPDNTTTGVPKFYAYYGDLLKFDPIPSGVFTLKLYGIARIAAPALDADANIWTNEAQDLIVGRVKMTLCRGLFRDPEGAQLAIGEIQDVLARLKRETARRLTAPRRMREPVSQPVRTIFS